MMGSAGSVRCGGIAVAATAGGGGGDGPTPSDSVASETAFGQAAAAGAATTYARGDHSHGTPADPIPAHVAAGDPHPQYQQAAEVDAAIDAALVDHVAAGDPHPQYQQAAEVDAAIAAELADHVAAGDPHAQYQLEAGKGAASGYASLDAGAKVPTAELGGAGADATKFLRGDQSWAAPPGGGGGEAFPIGSVFIAVVATNPATLLGYGTWAAFAAGRMLVGIDAGQTEFDAVRETGGAKTHALTIAEMPAHTHQVRRERSATTGGDTTQIARTADTSSTIDPNVFTESAGGGGAHNNLPPYIVVYMWERTA